jgi:hypothetical protein
LQLWRRRLGRCQPVWWPCPCRLHHGIALRIFLTLFNLIFCKKTHPQLKFEEVALLVAPGHVAWLLTESRQSMWRDQGATSAGHARVHAEVAGWVAQHALARLSRASRCGATHLRYPRLSGPSFFLLLTSPSLLRPNPSSYAPMAPPPTLPL